MCSALEAVVAHSYHNTHTARIHNVHPATAHLQELAVFAISSVCRMVCTRRLSLALVQAISNVGLLGILGLKAVGYCAFRGANSQKDIFRNDPSHPSVKHLQTLKTERGTQLITSGWWGIARHINYTGDWLMA